jgi:hypothetical protein
MPSAEQSLVATGPRTPAGPVALDASLTGVVIRTSNAAPVSDARVTPFTPSLNFFVETPVTSVERVFPVPGRLAPDLFRRR